MKIGLFCWKSLRSGHEDVQYKFQEPLFSGNMLTLSTARFLWELFNSVFSRENFELNDQPATKMNEDCRRSTCCSQCNINRENSLNHMFMLCNQMFSWRWMRWLELSFCLSTSEFLFCYLKTNMTRQTLICFVNFLHCESLKPKMLINYFLLFICLN